LNDFSAFRVNDVQFPAARTIFPIELTGDQSMATSFHGKSATILQFPKRIPRKVDERRSEATEKMDLASSDVCAAVDGCWYHEDALREETTKH
jgi:hypothetical protein